MVVGYILAFSLALIDFLTEGMFSKKNNLRLKIMSFSSGVSLSYLLLVLLPSIYLSASEFGRLLFIPVLLGFSVVYIIDRYASMRTKKSRRKKGHHVFHSLLSFTTFFLVGYILVRVADVSGIGSLLLFIPMALHIIIDSLPKIESDNLLRRGLDASSPIIGALTASFLNAGDIGNIILFSLVGGALIYIVVRESIPEHGKGKPMCIAVGMFIFTVLVMFFWNIGF